MKKKFKKIFIIVLLIPLVFLFSYIIFSLIFPNEEILITGDRSFEGSKVYADNKLVAIMTWDNVQKVTYAQDIRFINGDIFYKVRIPVQSNYKDAFSRPNISDSLDFKVITKDNKIYIYHAYNGEDLSYNEYPLKNFKRVK